MTAVLDTNIVASATYWRGKPAHCLEAWVLAKYDLAISHAILSEYEEVIARLSVRYPLKPPTDWLNSIRHAGRLYLPRAFGSFHFRSRRSKIPRMRYHRAS
jgi:predicted nucleic acid-binding protein